jgi:outer membrane protein
MASFPKLPNLTRARETLRVMEQSVFLAAATIYVDVSRDATNLDVQQNNVRELERTLGDTRNRFAAGQITPTDVAQAEAQLAAARRPSPTLMATKANYRRRPESVALRIVLSYSETHQGHKGG